ncbi:hypothetical protein IC229_15990 [Spirosoma sp. BT702]|uniref:Uncharacterized protein n=1 Tax=Spirosoma profusum TaxID=2771354 RepID=A0A926Y200_9BACT|nr:hypothetical protein [Spirosoma profusum]MBD2702153.1 hypothetical protein [Spirosoma profusum]
MRQRMNPWVVVLTAAVTFGSLMAFVGPRAYGHRYWGHHGYYRGFDRGHGYDGRCDNWRHEKGHSRPDSVDL